MRLQGLFRDRSAVALTRQRHLSRGGRTANGADHRSDTNALYANGAGATAVAGEASIKAAGTASAQNHRPATRHQMRLCSEIEKLANLAVVIGAVFVGLGRILGQNRKFTHPIQRLLHFLENPILRLAERDPVLNVDVRCGVAVDLRIQFDRLRQTCRIIVRRCLQ